MNLGLDELPARCDVLVVGAGPAGSAAAQLLARGGRDVVLVDQHAFPRDKVCGDGLIPDAHRALERLGVLDAVLAEAYRCGELACVAPHAGRLEVPGRFAVLPRKRLDEIVCAAAVAAGARMHAPVRFVEPLRETRPGGGGRVVGAVLRSGATTRDLEADHVVLASGATPQATIAAGMCERRTPSAVALRAYIRHPAFASRLKSLEVVWHRRLSPGYGWIFPCGDGVFNIGVGASYGHENRRRRAKADVNLRDMFEAFQSLHPAARELVAGGRFEGEPGEALKGAPLRCSLVGALAASAGLLVTGEAVGSTYALTGEGIGKAMETGMLAAEAILSEPSGAMVAAGDAAIAGQYTAGLAALRPRFEVYEQAHRANEHPWLVDLLVWSARRSPRRIERMSGVLDESHIPTDAMSWRGILRRLFGRR